MKELTRTDDKQSDLEGKNSVHQLQSGKSPLQISSPADRTMQLQRSIGNQAVLSLFEAAGIQPELTIGASNNIYEQEADRVADQVMRMPHPAVRLKPLNITSLIQCQENEEEEEVPLQAVQRQANKEEDDLSSRGALVQRKIATKNVPIDDYLSAKGITGFKKAGSVYSHLGVCIGEPEEEIVYNLLSSERTFPVAGVTAGEAKRNIDSHVKARKGVVEHTRKSKSAYRWGVNSSIKMNPQYWQKEKGRWGPKSGVGMVEAAKNVFSNPSRFDYAMACHLAAGVTMVAGSGSAQYWEKNSVTQDDWVPGDWGYIENKGYKPGKSAAGHEGENIIYVGKGQFWGHPQGQKTMTGWEDFIKLWDQKTGKPALWGMRKYTAVGLE